MKAALVATIILDIAVSARSQDPKTVPVAARPASEAVTLAAGDPASKLAPRYSPHGRELKLEPSRRPDVAGFDHLETRLKLGRNAETAAGHLLVLARGARGKPYKPAVRGRRRHRQTRATPITVEPKVARGKLWTQFQATLARRSRQAGRCRRG